MGIGKIAGDRGFAGFPRQPSRGGAARSQPTGRYANDHFQTSDAGRHPFPQPHLTFTTTRGRSTFSIHPHYNMYPIILTLHSWVRWLVLASLLYALYRGYRGWLAHQPFSTRDDRVRHWTATVAHIQLMLGLWLYWISPITDYFLAHFRDAVQQREIRFFGMEHSSMMLLAVVLITIGSMRAKRAQTDGQKFKMMTLWFTIGLLVILSSIPWTFSPLVSRPWFRSF